MPSPPPSHSHIPALDGLRGVAVLLVLGFHFGIGASFTGLDYLLVKLTRVGWMGVDLFFVLSGFLITGILYDERKGKRYFLNFYARRVLRIFPLYYLGILVAALLIAVWPPLEKSQTGGFIWPILYLSNVVIAADGWLAIPELLSHYWSLSVEEHFYLFWPFVVYLGTRQQLMVATAFLAAAAAALRVALLFQGTDPTAIFVLTPTRLDALSVGGFCSLAVRGPGGAAVILKPALTVMFGAFGGLISIVAFRRTVSEYDPVLQTVGFTLIALACGGGTIAATSWRPLNAALSTRALRWFGRYSYGLYIWHYLVYFLFYENNALFILLRVNSRPGSAAYALLALGITVALAIASYHGFEKQFLKLKSRFPRHA